MGPPFTEYHFNVTQKFICAGTPMDSDSVQSNTIRLAPAIPSIDSVSSNQTAVTFEFGFPNMSSTLVYNLRRDTQSIVDLNFSVYENFSTETDDYLDSGELHNQAKQPPPFTHVAHIAICRFNPWISVHLYRCRARSDLQFDCRICSRHHLYRLVRNHLEICKFLWVRFIEKV